MKKIFIFITFIFCFFFIYIFIFFFLYFKINNIVVFGYLKNLDEINFYKNYSEITHHLREPQVVQKKNNYLITEYIYNHVTEENSGETILFQGDSWFQQIKEYNSSNDFLKLIFDKKYHIVNSGSVSFSPSLMSSQYDLLKNKFNIKPSIVVSYIDQTDIGDENCRYKELKIFDSSDKLISVPYEKYPYYSGLGIDLFLNHSQINLEENLFLKTHLYINYKIKKTFFKITKSLEKKLDNKKFSGQCPFNKIQQYLINKNKSEIDYFKSSLKEYLEKLLNDKKLKKIFLVTHPHKIHIDNPEYLNVSVIVDDLVKNENKIIHINFSDLIKKNPKLYSGYKNLWLSDLSHLEEKPFNEIFLQTITNYLLNH